MCVCVGVTEHHVHSLHALKRVKEGALVSVNDEPVVL